MGLFDAIGSIFGGANNNANYTAQGLSPDQLNAAYGLTNNAISQQQGLANQLGAQGAQGMNAQTQLGQALLAQSQGQGPNPAAAQLNNTTGQNIAAQGALMAGQRGAGANVGLMARQAANQGAATQQNAVGQNAVLQAQQQLAAQGQLQNLAANQINQQSGAVGNLNQYSLANQGQLTGLQANQNSTNEAMASTNANNSSKGIGGLFGGIAGAAMGSGLLGSGLQNMVTPQPKYDGGEIESDPYQAMHKVYHGHHFEHKESPKLAKVPKIDRFKEGGKVPGKPKVDHNDPKNDTVKAVLSPGEIVIPLDVMNSEDPAGNAAKFVAAILAKKGNQSDNNEKDDFKNALKEAIKSRKK